jgi:hypothetical protein
VANTLAGMSFESSTRAGAREAILGNF